MGGDPEAVGPERDGAVFFPQDLRGGESTGGPLGGTGQSLQWAPGASSGGERAGQQVLWSWGSREESALQGWVFHGHSDPVAALAPEGLPGGPWEPGLGEARPQGSCRCLHVSGEWLCLCCFT